MNNGRFKKGQKAWNKGIKGKDSHIFGISRSEETRKKMSIGIKKNHPMKGKKLPNWWKKKVSDSLKGKKKKPFSIEHRRKLSESNRRRVGKKAANWQGGKSYEKYPIDWKKTLKLSIRERDKFTCQLCYKIEQNGKILDVHHIDYNKHNCSPDNLITLCRSCHMKTNSKRDYWKEYFLKTNNSI